MDPKKLNIMSEKEGITALKHVIDVVVTLAKTYEKVKEDGKVSFLDSIHIARVVPRVIKSVAKSGNALAEVQDLDADEKKELVAYFKAEFDLADDAAEKKVEDMLSMVTQYSSLLPQALTLAKSLKG